MNISDTEYHEINSPTGLRSINDFLLENQTTPWVRPALGTVHCSPLFSLLVLCDVKAYTVTVGVVYSEPRWQWSCLKMQPRQVLSETPRTHTLDFEFVFGSCILRALLLLPAFPQPTPSVTGPTWGCNSWRDWAPDNDSLPSVSCGHHCHCLNESLVLNIGTDEVYKLKPTNYWWDLGSWPFGCQNWEEIL